MNTEAKKPDVVIAGQDIYAGIDETERSKLPYAMVVEFESKEAFIKAMNERKIEFSWFGTE